TNRKKIIAIVLIASGLLCLTRPYNIDFLFTFLNLLGVIVPPLAGIILANYYIVNKRHYPDIDSDLIKDWDIAPWISWAIALVLVKILEGFATGGGAVNGIFGLPALNGIVAGFISYTIISKFTKKGA